MKSFIIAGTHSGVGKTTIAIGLMAALRKKGYVVQPFKVGPDYIDPSYHNNAVCGRPSYNLDTWMMGVEGVQKTFANAMATSQPLNLSTSSASTVGIIEGVMGLFDGKDGKNEAGSTAHVAKVLGAPIILVVDARSMARSVGALVYGYERFDPKVKIAGVIFNRVGSERHFQMLKEAIENKCSAKVLGYIPRDEEIVLPERHLGLVMIEKSEVRSLPLQAVSRGQKSEVKKIGELIERFVDVDSLLKIDSRFKIQDSRFKIENRKSKIENVRIAIALDNAFCFYYQENLDILKQCGAELIFFSPLKDKKLPKGIQGIYIGGGYPELYAKRLEANKFLRKAIKDFADKGFPIYAECGGLMYLGKRLKDLKGKRYKMVGVFPWVSRMLAKRKSLGYREVRVADNCPFLKKGEKIRGHEYHYSEIDEPAQRVKRVYHIITPDRNIQGQAHHASRITTCEGYLYKNTLASYIHIHFASNLKFAEGFAQKCKSILGGLKND